MSRPKEDEKRDNGTSDEILLYDLPSKGTTRHCWSPNPWKTRLLLNYKSLPYRTVWVEYPDIKSQHLKHGIPPNPPGVGAEYTIPAVYIPAKTDGEKGIYMQDSKVIAQHLEQLHPEPALQLDSTVLSQVEPLIPKIMGALAPVVMPRIPRSVLNERSAEYFAETRAKRFGMPLDELEKSATGGEAAWQAARPHLEEMSRLLSQKEGPFFLGEEVSYADFVLVAFLRFVRVVGENDVFGRICEMDKDGGFERLYNACKTWLERDDH